MKKYGMFVIIALYLLLTMGFLYFTWVHTINKTADIFKFLTIVLSFLASAFFLRYSFSRYDGLLLTAAMFLTVIADIYSVFYARTHQVEFIILYIMTMITYFLRYNYKRLKNTLFLPLFLIIPVALRFLCNYEWFFLYGNRQQTLIIVTTFYIQTLLAVMVSMVKSVKRGRFPKTNSIILAAAYISFCLGDIAVMLCNLDYFNILLFRRLIWVFYTPSQALLAFSSLSFKRDVSKDCQSALDLN